MSRELWMSVGVFGLTLVLGAFGIAGAAMASGRDVAGFGFGRCSFSYCNCRSFVGDYTQRTCTNCGHNQGYHY